LRDDGGEGDSEIYKQIFVSRIIFTKYEEEDEKKECTQEKKNNTFSTSPNNFLLFF
jgi:hypothetical protein